MTQTTSNSAVLRWLAIAAVVGGGLLWFALTRKPTKLPVTTERGELEATAAPAPVALPAPAAQGTAPAPTPSFGPPPVTSAKLASAAEPPPARGALEAAFEREVPDATAAQAEARVREIFKQQPDSDIVFRHVICTRSVCKIDLRWSPELSDSYNGGLIKVVEEFSRELALEPEDPVTPETPMPVPMVAFIARKGYSIEGLLAEEAAGRR
jgi:hypothetical protein